MYKTSGIDTFSVQLVCENGSRLCLAAKMSEAEIVEYWNESKVDPYSMSGNKELWIGGVVVDSVG
jgi:hypothetical protein